MNDSTDASSAAKAILAARARALARPPQTVARGSELEVLEFRLANERYALETRHVSEVFPLRDLTSVPCTPAFIRGIVSVRGRITSVIDLKRFFDLPQEGLTDLHRVILVRNDELELGLLADAISGVQLLALEALQPSLPTLNGIGSDYLKGVTADQMVVLDLDRILADPRIIVQEEVEN